MPKTMREILEESFNEDEQELEEEARVSETEDEPEIQEEVSEEETDAPGVEEGSDDDDARDSEGDETDQILESVSDDADESRDEGSSEDLKAPASWKPSIREHWKGLPNDVKQEVLRREQDIQKGLQQASGYKKVAEEYLTTIKPFESVIRAQNATPSQAIGNLLQTATRLTLGTPTQKAQAIAEAIKEFSVDIETLDQVLAGEELPNTQNDPLLQELDKRLQPMNDFMSQFQSAEKTQLQEIQDRANAELSQFASEHEFYNDVKEDMADLMELAGNRGRSITLEQAYDQACLMNPDIKKVLDHRTSRLRNTPDPQELAKKKAAASSVKSQNPTGVSSAGSSGSLRDSIAAAFEDDGGRI